MTLPGLVAAYQKKVIAVQFKKFYSEISQAYEMAKVKYGDPEGWGTYNGGSHFHPDAETIFGKVMKAKYCSQVDSKKYENYLKEIAKSPDRLSSIETSLYGGKCWVLQDGKIIYDYTVFNYSYLLGSFVVDVNGLAKPNKMGKDIHIIYFLHNINSTTSVNVGNGAGNCQIVLEPAMKSGVYPGGLGWISGRYDRCNKDENWACTAKLVGDGMEFKKDYPW